MTQHASEVREYKAQWWNAGTEPRVIDSSTMNAYSCEFARLVSSMVAMVSESVTSVWLNDERDNALVVFVLAHILLSDDFRYNIRSTSPASIYGEPDGVTIVANVAS